MGKVKLSWIYSLMFFFWGSSCNVVKKYQRTMTKYNQCFSSKAVLPGAIKHDGYYSIPVLYSGDEHLTNVFFSDNGFVISGLQPEDLNWKAISGIYNISKDTITTFEFIQDPTLNHKGIFISKYLIIDSNTLQEIYGFVVDYNKEVNRPVGGIGKFIPLSETPDLKKFWLLQQKWFWCDEKEYDIFWHNTAP